MKAKFLQLETCTCEDVEIVLLSDKYINNFKDKLKKTWRVDK